MVGVVALVVAHWGLTTKDALDRGIFNFDSLWYHMPFAVDMAQSHSRDRAALHRHGLHELVLPAELGAAPRVGILLTGRDTLSLFLNFGWLAVAFLAAWCIGRPYGRGQLTVVAAAILLECHTLVVREPGAAKNDLMAAALLLPRSRSWSMPGTQARPASEAPGLRPVGWAAGWPPGSPPGSRSGPSRRLLAMAAALTLAVIVLAPGGTPLGGGRLVVRAGAGGRRLLVPAQPVVAGNPLPQVEHLGPISLPHPERLQEGRPDFSIAHYATDTGVWRHYFEPGLHQAFGALWPLVIARARSPAACWPSSAAATGSSAGSAPSPSSASSPTSSPRSAPPAPTAPRSASASTSATRSRPCCSASSCCRLPPRLATIGAASGPCWRVLLAVLLVTDRADAALRDPARLFGSLLVVARSSVLIPAALPGCAAAARGAARGVGVARRLRRAGPRRRSRSATRSSATTCEDRFANAGPGRASPACTSTPPTAGRAT